MPSAPLGGWGIINFQIGTADIEPQVATNCVDCHADTRMHSSFFAVTFTPDICKSCHDYEQQMPGKSEWTDANAGFGAAPLARRVHGVHYGAYLDKPDEVHAVTNDFDASEIIFPQDIRNCQKCHSADTSGTWNTNPNRIACLGCHDEDSAIAHANTMTLYFDPGDPYNANDVETCEICHGADADFSAAKVHNISDPYVPPYPRDPSN